MGGMVISVYVILGTDANELFLGTRSLLLTPRSSIGCFTLSTDKSSRGKPMAFLLRDAVSPWVSVFTGIILSSAVIGADVQGISSHMAAS